MAGMVYYPNYPLNAAAALWGADGSGMLIKDQVIDMGNFASLAGLIYGLNINGDIRGVGRLTNGQSSYYIAYLVLRFPNVFNNIYGTASGSTRDNVRLAGDGKVMTVVSALSGSNYLASNEFQFYGVPASQTPSFNVRFTLKSTGSTYTDYSIFNYQTSSWDALGSANLTANTWRTVTYSVTNQTYQYNGQSKYKYVDDNGKMRIKYYSSQSGSSYTLSLDNVQINLN
jgi:hypothetical protein